MLTQRQTIGTDINPLAQLVAQAKTTIFTNADFSSIQRWLDITMPKLKLRGQPQNRIDEWAERGYQKDVPWRIRNIIRVALAEIPNLETEQQRSFVRCALLKTGRWALDCKEWVPSVERFRTAFYQDLMEALAGAEELRNAIGRRKPKVVCLDIPAASLTPSLWKDRIKGRASLIVTSPPYPGVNVLYHRWQIGGRKATPAPYWIADRLDGNGLKYYTMGGPSQIGFKEYFLSIENTFQQLRKLLKPDGTVVQLIGFSNVDEQLPLYLDAMLKAGFTEVPVNPTSDIQERIWRQIPSRRWYATFKGQISSSQEILLIHQKS